MCQSQTKDRERATELPTLLSRELLNEMRFHRRHPSYFTSRSSQCNSHISAHGVRLDSRTSSPSEILDSPESIGISIIFERFHCFTTQTTSRSPDLGISDGTTLSFSMEHTQFTHQLASSNQSSGTTVFMIDTNDEN